MNYCLGTVQFGMNYGVQGNGSPDLDEIYEILDIALKNNIYTFDTAVGYGNAEAIIGNYIKKRNLNENNIHIITKDRSNIFGANLVDNIKSSLGRLNINRLYGFLYHDAKVVEDKYAMQFLFQIREMNLSDKVGVSVYYPEEAMKAVEYGVDIIQIPYNLFDNKWNISNFFEKATKKNIEIYSRSSLLQGLLVMNPNELQEEMQFAKPYLEKYIKICDKYGYSQLEGAIGYVVSNKYIDYTVFGVDSINQFNQYISLRNIQVSDGFIDELRHEFSIVPTKLVNPSMW